MRGGPPAVGEPRFSTTDRRTSFAKIARRKLIQLNNAEDLGDLTVPPGNRFEVLKGNLAGRYSIRINDQWRIVFRWTSVGPEEVEIRDYH